MGLFGIIICKRTNQCLVTVSQQVDAKYLKIIGNFLFLYYYKIWAPYVTHSEDLVPVFYGLWPGLIQVQGHRPGMVNNRSC